MFKREMFDQNQKSMKKLENEFESKKVQFLIVPFEKNK